MLNKGFTKVQQDVNYDPKKIYHKDIYCYNCQKDKLIFLEGHRYKCLNCPNLNSC